MPFIKLLNKEVVLANYDYSEKYWPILTELVYREIGESRINNPLQVQSILKECFKKLCSIFEIKIKEQRKASFYLFLQYLHEDSLEIWQEPEKGEAFKDVEEDFAGSRRVLKIILEQSCKLSLTGTPNFFLEIVANKNAYIEYLEELLYIGTWCFGLSEYIARSQILPKSLSIEIENGGFKILVNEPYSYMFSFLFRELQNHDREIVYSDSINGFKGILEHKLLVDYNVLADFINRQLEHSRYRFGFLRIRDIIHEISNTFGYDKEFVTSFYEGLTITKSNSLDIEKCFLANQHENRYVFRPILEIEVDGKIYHMIGYHKWIESFFLLSTNSFPFGQYPSEWKKYKEIKGFMEIVENTHDKLILEPLKLILKNRIFETNIDSFIQRSGNNINLRTTIGDIDVLFLEEKYKIIYVCECKHNRSRYDWNNWRRDYTKFKNRYEDQLERKISWVETNIKIVENHLNHKYSQRFINLDEYQIVGIFIINSPTLYMFNGKYRAFTLSDIKDLLNGEYLDIKIEFTDEKSGVKMLIEHPYFDNLEKQNELRIQNNN